MKKIIAIASLIPAAVLLIAASTQKSGPVTSSAFMRNLLTNETPDGVVANLGLSSNLSVSASNILPGIQINPANAQNLTNLPITALDANAFTTLTNISKASTQGLATAISAGTVPVKASSVSTELTNQMVGFASTATGSLATAISAGSVPVPATGKATNNAIGASLIQMVGPLTTNPVSTLKFPFPLIVDCDPGTDTDELALTTQVINWEKMGMAKNIAWTTPVRPNDGNMYSNAAIALEVISRNAGLQIPIGINRAAQGQVGTEFYAYYLASNWPHSSMSQNYESAVRVWRRALANAADNSVVIQTGGGAWNIYYFLQSGADDISPLTGPQLEAQKVKLWIIGAGNWPTPTNSPIGGTEYNYSGFSGSAMYAWTWLTNNPVWLFGIDSIYADGWITNFNSAFTYTNRWKRFANDSLVKKVDGYTGHAQAFPICDPVTIALMHPEWMYGTTGTIYNSYGGANFGTNHFTTNALGNCVFWRFNTNYATSITNVWESTINQPYGETTRAFDTVLGLFSEFFVSSTTNSAGVVDLAGYKARPVVGGLKSTNDVEVAGDKPANFTGANYKGMWLNPSKSGVVGVNVAGYRGATIAANVVFNEAAGSYRSVDTTSPSWIAHVVYETGGAVEGFRVYRAPASSGNLAFVEMFAVGPGGTVFNAGLLTNLNAGALTGLVATISGDKPANYTGLNYPGVWLNTARGGIVGSAVANYRGVYFSANAVFNESASSFRSVDTSSPAWLIQLLHETGGGAEGFDLLRAPATSGNLALVSLFNVNSSGNVRWVGTATGNGGSVTNVKPANIDWSAISTAAFTNGVAARIPVYTNAGTIYYLTLSTNTP